MGKLHKVSDYRPLAYKTPNVKLTFELDPDKTIVQSELEVVRTQVCKLNEKLTFDCKNLDLGYIKVNGRKLSKDQYDISHGQVTIHVPPSEDEFTVEFENYIYPSKVEDYGGIYRSGDKEKTNEIFTSHCEAEEFRAITPYIDRPDNLAIFTTLIIADREKILFYYPMVMKSRLVHLMKKGTMLCAMMVSLSLAICLHWLPGSCQQ